MTNIHDPQTGAPLSFEEIEAKLEKPVVTWKPHRDATQPRTIIGRVLDRYTKTSDYKAVDGKTRTYPVLVLEDLRSEIVWATYCSAAQLKGKVERHDPRIGDLVGVRFVGFADEDDEDSAQRWNLEIAGRAASSPSEVSGDGVVEGPPPTEPDQEGGAGGGHADDIPFQ